MAIIGKSAKPNLLREVSKYIPVIGLGVITSYKLQVTSCLLNFYIPISSDRDDTYRILEQTDGRNENIYKTDKNNYSIYAYH